MSRLCPNVRLTKFTVTSLVRSSQYTIAPHTAVFFVKVLHQNETHMRLFTQYSRELSFDFRQILSVNKATSMHATQIWHGSSTLYVWQPRPGAYVSKIICCTVIELIKVALTVEFEGNYYDSSASDTKSDSSTLLILLPFLLQLRSDRQLTIKQYGGHVSQCSLSRRLKFKTNDWLNKSSHCKNKNKQKAGKWIQKNRILMNSHALHSLEEE